MKKDGLLDVTIGRYDGAELCKVVDTFWLNKISEKNMIKVALAYFTTTGCHYSKRKVALNLK